LKRRDIDLKKKEIIYRAIGNISEDMAADAYLNISEKQKSHRLRAIFGGIGAAALVCSFFVLSFVLLRFSGPRTDPPSDSGTATDTETVTDTDTTPVYTDPVRALIEKHRAEKGSDYTENDYEFIKELAKLIYSREDTTITQFCLLQEFDREKYEVFRSVIVRPDFYYDDRYEKRPVYENGEETGDPVWYLPPYVRYQISGFPDRYDEQSYVTHIDICGINDVAVCGITVNSTFDEFESTFKNLGFNVTRSEMDLLYSNDRNIITAEYNGLWIILEQASEANDIEAAYGYDAAAVRYENDTVPAILRIGVAVQSMSPVEQYELP
jgi:hypothetical protein